MELKDLYRDVILDHNRRPRNFGPLAGASTDVEGFNPLCGDRLTLHLRFAGDRVEDVRFEGQGCAISTASASLMTESIKGKTRAEALALFERVHALLTDDSATADDALGKLAALSGVREFPARVKCASLCWHTLATALRSPAPAAIPAVSTE
ncbi:MAG TPA: SUF system NifU family Fe-S cluster assembly protein [Steroidobacteraceae bacterium]|nr:SUF system NifU family Fe-S cluster assembly protein [Steroidobacteraceae bacterium]